MINGELNIIIKSRKKTQHRNILDYIDIQEKSKNRREINNGYIQAIEHSISNCNTRKSARNDRTDEYKRNS